MPRVFRSARDVTIVPLGPARKVHAMSVSASSELLSVAEVRAVSAGITQGLHPAATLDLSRHSTCCWNGGVDVLSSRILLRPGDLGRSHRFYRDVLGLAVYREFGPPEVPGVVFFLGPGF